MLVTGLQNVENLNADYFLPYAGFSKSYVKNKDFNLSAFNPTYKNLKEMLNNEKNTNIEKLINIFPGGTFDLNTGNTEYPFSFNPEKLLNITNDYLINEDFIKNYDTYNTKFNNKELNISKLEDYQEIV